MGLFDFWKPKQPIEIVDIKRAPSSLLEGGYGSVIHTESYTGEKNLGELGPAIDYRPDHYELRVRSWQAYLESDIAKAIIDKFTTWVIDKGLRLKANPSKIIPDLETEKFNEQTEALFNVWSKSRISSWSGMTTLNDIAKEAYKNAKLGGDVLVVLRYVKGIVKVELIDGAHVQSPLGTLYLDSKIVDGVEVDSTGRHIAYHVRKNMFESERIPAVSKSSGFTTAFLVYGERYRVGTRRGIPIISTVLEAIKKLERYREAAVGSAEERQKIVLFVKHEVTATGKSPFGANVMKAYNANGSNQDLPTDSNGQEVMNSIYATANKRAINLEPGSELSSIESKQEMFFKDFYETNADIICAAMGIPPEVARSLYHSSFSASRAATKDWDHSVEIQRDDFQSQFYQPIYNFWLYTEILKGNIQAPGYLTARINGDQMLTEAYYLCRFTGPMFPHIDPLKEVNAERAKLGKSFDHVPLTTVENATEVLNGGDSDSNMEQAAEELKYADELGIEKITASGSAEPLPEEEDTDKEEAD